MAETLRPDINVPVRLRIKSAWITEGKLWEGKQLPPQLALKGLQPGRTESDYLYVDQDCAVTLEHAGAKLVQGEKGPKYENIPNAWWTITKKKTKEFTGWVMELEGPKGARPAEPQAVGKTAAQAGNREPAQAEPAPPEETQDERIIKLYQDSLRRCVTWAEAYNAVENHSIKFTSSDIHAMTATLFISRRG